MPIVSNLELLDYVSGGYPFMLTVMDGVDGDGLDLTEGGAPLYASLGEVSTSIMRVSQMVTEILRDGDDPPGGNLRVTAIAREILILNKEQVYVTAFHKERMYKNPAPEIQGGKAKSWMVFDEENHLDVLINWGDPPVSAANDLAVLNGANMALWGNELLQFRDVANVSGNVYRLSWLLRGRYGTEGFMRSHTTGDRFVLLDTSTVRRILLGDANIGINRLYKAVTVGQTIQQAITRPFTNYARGLKPYAPCFVVGARDGGNNLTISWTRRTRFNGEWRDLSDVPLGETDEAYEVDVYDSVGNIVRTIEVLTNSAAYSAADQTTDFGAPQSLITVTVYQMSSVVGRGYGTNIAI